MDSASGRRDDPVSAAESSERPGSLPATRAGGSRSSDLPGGDVVGEAGDGLEFGGFEGGAGNLCLGGELRGIEEAAERDGDLLAEQQAKFAGELVLARDPRLVGGGAEGEDGFAADGGCGEAGQEREQRLPLEGGSVGVFDRGRDGIEQRHGLHSV